MSEEKGGATRGRVSGGGTLAHCSPYVQNLHSIGLLFFHIAVHSGRINHVIPSCTDVLERSQGDDFMGFEGDHAPPPKSKPLG